MSDQNAATPPPPAPVESKPPSGFRTALRYTGIPTSWLDKRPRLPSRNWLIFLSVTSTLTGYYIYDRRQCKRIKQRYIDLVKDRAEEPVDPLAWPRKVTVYGAKWPGDEDYDQAIKYFRKYVKPILVAAAVDFEMIPGKRHGDIAERVAEDIRKRRRLELGLDPIPEVAKALPTYKSPAEVAQHRLQGGIVIVGRPTLKEFMAGLKKGWTEGLANVDQEELLARELESDGHFDEPEEGGDDSEAHYDKKSNTPFNAANSPVFSPLQMRPPPSQPKSPKPDSLADSMSAPPASIPPVPPLLLVSFINHIGFTQIPIMIWEWFNQRHKVRAGSEAGYRLVMAHTRPMNAPAEQPETMFADITIPDARSDKGDLDFDKEAESWYKKSLAKIPEDIEKARNKYYEELPAKLATARALARGTREPTKEEVNNPRRPKWSSAQSG
ncbi:putative inner membrane protein import complex subunit Tim54 [Lyophyllum shimeji]|uniref:Mitochondrial import inner membrane translocase subunit TIM54 n=1 Tax=Lyophyllum shimeji TaxID=47721 RepID=A0A9P3UKX5_LYOSH|nr:putative inner membrane protein import complex subunit Tim54 [Lyophyllum shimeji]